MTAPRATTTFLVAAVTMVVLAAGGCARLGARGPGMDRAMAAATQVVDPPRRDGAPLLFIAMPIAPAFHETRKALVAETSGTFNVTTFVVTPDTRAADFRAALDAAAPACIVLMNNGTVRMYRDYQRERPGATFPPAVIVMTSFLEDIRREIKRATGIAYEVPGVTAFVSLRALIRRAGGAGWVSSTARTRGRSLAGSGPSPSRSRSSSYPSSSAAKRRTPASSRARSTRSSVITTSTCCGFSTTTACSRMGVSCGRPGCQP